MVCPYVRYLSFCGFPEDVRDFSCWSLLGPGSWLIEVSFSSLPVDCCPQVPVRCSKNILWWEIISYIFCTALRACLGHVMQCESHRVLPGRGGGGRGGCSHPAMSSADAISCVVMQSLLAGRTWGGERLSPCVRIKPSPRLVWVIHWGGSGHCWLWVRGQTWELLLQHKAGGCFYKARGHKHPASAFGAAAPEGRSLVQGCELGFLFLAPALLPRHTSPSSSKSQMRGAPTTASAPHVHTGAAWAPLRPFPIWYWLHSDAQPRVGLLSAPGHWCFCLAIDVATGSRRETWALGLHKHNWCSIRKHDTASLWLCQLERHSGGLSAKRGGFNNGDISGNL